MNKKKKINKIEAEKKVLLKLIQKKHKLNKNK